MLLVSVLLLVLPMVLNAQVPSGCDCLPGCKDVRCNAGTMNRLPIIPSHSTQLDLSNNRFTNPVLQRSNFTGYLNLERLTLKGCGISSIEYNTFVGMTKLKLLDLSFNNLMVIGDGTLTGLRLEYLYLEHNPTITLGDNSFSGMSTEVLSLKACNLVQVRYSIFKPIMSSLRKLMLQGNKLERIDADMLEVFSKVQTARIYDNPLICDCKSRWLKEFYDLNKDTTVIRDAQMNTAQEPRCDGPGHVAGQFFNRLSITDFSCDRPTLQAEISFTKDKGTLTCVSRGNPKPTVSWRKPNGVVAESLPKGAMQDNRNEIEVLASEPDTLGEYRCVASSDGGNISLSVNVDWPFQAATDSDCNSATKAPKDVMLTNSDIDTSDADSQTNVFQTKYFTLVDIVAAILGTFVCTLVITVVTLHFCVYRRKKVPQYTTPAMSEYSSSNGSDKNGPYPISMHSLPTPHHQQPQRPLPNKPYHKIYDENHYMATNLEERDEFLRLSAHQAANGRITPASSSCDTCPACRTMPHSHVS